MFALQPKDNRSFIKDDSSNNKTIWIYRIFISLLREIPNDMKTTELIKQLDQYFDIEHIDSDLPFSRVLPREYGKTDIHLSTYFTKTFLEHFHGLLIQGSSEIRHVYLAVFLSNEIVGQLILQDAHDALIFTHHPMDFESNGRGFLPLSQESLEELTKRGLSVYAVHTPLDIHPLTNTSLSIANALHLHNTIRFSEWFNSYAGIIGSLQEPMPMQSFLELVRTTLGIQDLWFHDNNVPVQKIGIIAGGGADVTYMKEARSLGCDTYLSGDILNRVQTPNSLEKRKEFEEQQNQLDLNLIGASHYATEKCVLVHEMKDYFDQYGLSTTFLSQKNPWK